MNMLTNRRGFLIGSSALATSTLLPGFASAAAYPTKAIEMVIGANPGGGMDTYGRALAGAIAPFLNDEPMVAVNKPGANTLLALETVASSAPDGYTVNVTTAGTVVLYRLWEGEGPNLATDLRPVGTIGRYNSVIAVRKDSPYKNLKDLADAIKASDKPILWAHTGHGSVHHVAVQAVLNAMGVTANPVPYSGGSKTRQGLLIGEVEFAALSTTNLTGFEEEVRAIAIVADERNKFFPDVMTVAEQGVDAPELSTRIIIHVPKDTPDDIAAILEKAVESAAKSDDYAELVNKSGLEVYYRSAEDSQTWAENAMSQWAPAVKEIKASVKE